MACARCGDRLQPVPHWRGMAFAADKCMSKHINVNPNFYKVGGREHAEGADKGHSGNVNAHVGKGKRRAQQQELPGHKGKQPKR